MGLFVIFLFNNDSVVQTDQCLLAVIVVVMLDHFCDLYYFTQNRGLPVLPIIIQMQEVLNLCSLAFDVHSPFVQTLLALGLHLQSGGEDLGELLFQQHVVIEPARDDGDPLVETHSRAVGLSNQLHHPAFELEEEHLEAVLFRERNPDEVRALRRVCELLQTLLQEPGLAVLPPAREEHHAVEVDVLAEDVI